MKKIVFVSAILIGLGSQPGYASSDSTTQPVRPAGTAHDLSAGYVKSGMVPLPDSKALLPAPPAKDSVDLASDGIANLNGLELRGSKRWALAIQDADLTFPNAAGTFSCALGAPITEKDTPHLYTLLRRTLSDAGRSTGKAKKDYNRKRPFLVNNVGTCTPDDENFLKSNGSYPSGHSTTGWTWALILSEIAPERADAILRRGLAFGDSRVICNVHWESDVVEGRVLGAGVVARLHADSEFRKDVEEAKKELAEVRAKGLPPQRDCAVEAEALGK